MNLFGKDLSREVALVAEGVPVRALLLGADAAVEDGSALGAVAAPAERA